MFFKPPAHYKIFGKLRATNWEAEYHHENEHLTEIFLNVHENIYELWNIFIILLLFGILPILRISRPCLKSEVLHFMAPRGQSSFIVGADLYARFWYPLKYSIFRTCAPMTTEIYDVFQTTQGGESGQLCFWYQSGNSVGTGAFRRPHDRGCARATFAEFFQQIHLQTIICLSAWGKQRNREDVWSSGKFQRSVIWRSQSILLGQWPAQHHTQLGCSLSLWSGTWQARSNPGWDNTS